MPFDFTPQPEFKPCECCRSGYTGTTYLTSSTFGHRFTRKEIERELIALTYEMTNASFWDRGDIRRRMKHWLEKLKRYDDAREEFDFK